MRQFIHFLLFVFIFVQGNEFDDDETELLSSSDPCDPRNCHATFEHVYSVPVKLRCETASGQVPNAAHLPLLYPGDYDQCSRVFEKEGHFCTIDTYDFLAIPLRKGVFRFTGEGFPLGRLHLGRCVSKLCTAELLRKSFLKGLKKTAKKIRRQMPLQLFVPYLEETIINATFVRCVDEDEKIRGNILDRSSSVSAFILCVFLILMVVASSYFGNYEITDNNGESKPSYSSRLSWIFSCFSVQRNWSSLFSPIKGDFSAFNGIRVLSIIWIIFGHVVLYSSGLAYPFPVLNPSVVDEQIQSPYILLSRGAEYSVDTFFFMSGFLACWGTLNELSKKSPSLKLYFQHFLLRYFRLTPVYAFVLVIYMKLYPFFGSGPFYHALQSFEYKEEECKYWWSNLLYINNLYPYGEKGGLRGCMGWSWYLANDMQYFLMVFPSVSWFLYFRTKQTSQCTRFEKIRNSILIFLPPILLLLIQISTTWYTMKHWEIFGAFDQNYNVHLYVKPWCRIAPFAVAMGYAFWHFNRVENLQNDGESEVKWKENPFCGFNPHLLAFISFCIMLSIVLSLYDQFRCKLEKSEECKIWSGFTNFGALVSDNWNYDQLTAYFVLSYGSWSIAIGALLFYFFSGRGMLINKLLSHSYFVPLSRLTYNVYLVHIPVIQFIYTTSPSPTFISKKGQSIETVYVVIVSFLISLFLYLLVEKPCMNLMFGMLNSRNKKVLPGGVNTQPLLSSTRT